MREEKNIHIRKPYHTPLVEFEKVESDDLLGGSDEANEIVEDMPGDGDNGDIK